MPTVTDRESLLKLGKTAQRAARELARLTAEPKNQALLNVAGALEDEQGPILEANSRDYTSAEASGMDSGHA